MKVTRELIEKYLRGECPVWERQLVEQWMHSCQSEETSLSDQVLENMSAGIWASLENSLPAHTDRFRIVRWNTWNRLAVAACLSVGLVGLSFFLVNRNARTEVAFSSYGVQHQLKGVARQMEFLLQPNSSVNGSISRYGGQGQLNFTGALKVVSGKAVEIHFGAEATAISRKAVIENGQVYYVGLLKQTGVPDEILVLSSEQIQDIPPRIRIMAFGDANI
nr:hypothetical protein [uncultured Dyadobacter sp.]